MKAVVFHGIGDIRLDSVPEPKIEDEPVTIVQDERLRWPDTFSQGPDGAMYVTASHIQDMRWYRPERPLQVHTALFRFEPTG